MIVFIKKNSFIKNPDIEEEYYLSNGFKKVELDKKYADCVYEDFNEDLTFNPVKFSTRKTLELTAKYEERVVELIRKKYSLNQELAILRQRETKPEEYQDYFDYVEQCKAEGKTEAQYAL